MYTLIIEIRVLMNRLKTYYKYLNVNTEIFQSKFKMDSNIIYIVNVPEK